MDKKRLNLVGLAVPIFVEQFLNKLLTMVNVYLLSRLSQEAVGAIGVANQFLNFITMAFSFVTFGAAVVIAQNRGAGEEERAAEASTTAVVANVVFGLAVGALLLLLHGPLLRAMNLEGQMYADAAVYLCIIGGCCFVQALNLTLATVMRNYGEARAPMLVFLFMNAINLVGNAAVVLRPFGLPDFGIAGIALCTVLSQVLACALMIACAVRAKVRLRLSRPFPFPLLRSILRIGLPGTGDGLACNFGNIFLTWCVSTMGADALAAHTYAVQLIAFVQVLGYSVGQASQILVGYRCGARDFDGAYKLAFHNTWIAMGLNLAVIFALLLLHRPILALFTDSGTIVQMVFLCLLVDVVQEFGRPFNLVIGVSLRGTGDVLWALFAAVGSIGLICIPLGYVLTQVFHLGVYAVFIALMADEWVRGQLMTYRWRTRKWQKYVLIRERRAA